MMRKQQVAIIIPNWNGEDFIINCIESLVDQSMAAEIVVVDNGSVDLSVSLVKATFPSTTIIELPKNLGFAGGVNTGIRYALERGYEYVVLFNNDAVADKQWLQRLVEAADRHPRVGIVTGKLMSIDKKHFDSAGETFYDWGVPTPRGRGEKDSGQFDNPAYLFGATAGASLYKSKLINQIGLFDEDFFAYYEDSDINFRAQLSGWEVYYEPKAIAYHHINATAKRIHGLHAYNMSKNMPWLIIKNVPLSLLPEILLRFSLFYCIILAGLVKKGQGIYALKGIFMSLIYLPKKCCQRWYIQRHRNVKDDYIKSLFTIGTPPGASKLSSLLSLFGVKI
jgi:hypothetical protein